MKQTSGIPTFDDFIEGGFGPGDNVVWLAQNRRDLDPVVGAFLAVRPDSPGDGPVVRRHICLGDPSTCGHPERFGPELVVHPLAGRSDPVGDGNAAALRAEFEAVVLADDLGVGARVVVSALDDLVSRFGAEATVDIYRRTCPRLFDRGAIAYWIGSRELVGALVSEGVTRIAQCVFELREGRLRVVKAEGRSSWLQGAMVDLDLSGEWPVASREHAVGRLGEGLRRVRADRGLTQAQLAELAGVTPAAISQAETGRRGLSLDTIVPLVDTLGLGLDDLLGTGRRRGPFIARPDRRPASSRSAVFDDPDAGPLVQLVELAGGQTGGVPIAGRGTELVLCIDGLVMVDLGDTNPVLRARDALMVTERSVVSFTNLGESPASLFWIST